MNSQQLRLVGFIALVIVIIISIEPFKEFYSAQKKFGKWEKPRRSNFANDFHGDYWYDMEQKSYNNFREERNSRLEDFLPYLIGILILVVFVSIPQTIGSKIGVLKQKQNN